MSKITFIKNVFNLFMERKEFFLTLFIQHMYLTFLAILIITVIGIALGIYMTRNKVLAGFIIGTASLIFKI